MYFIWIVAAIVLFFIAFEMSISFWINLETDKEMSKSKEMIRTILNKVIRKSVS